MWGALLPHGADAEVRPLTVAVSSGVRFRLLPFVRPHIIEKPPRGGVDPPDGFRLL